jgi:dTDP-4-amino-4,6-dideoxygalactose transaminase
VVSAALSDIPHDSKFNLNFDLSYAKLLYEKAIEVTFHRNMETKEMDRVVELFN